MRTILSLLLLICATTMQAQDTNEYYGFKALLNGKIAVELIYYNDLNDHEWMSAGYIYYPNAKAPAPIMIVENWGDEKYVVPEEDNIYKARFLEFTPEGENTGIINIRYAEVEGDYQVLDAQWTNPTTGKVMQFSNFEEMRQKPDWFPGAPAVFTAPKREAWQIWYRLYNENDEDSEWLDKINVSFMANDQKDEKLSFDDYLNGSVNSEMEEKLDWVIEKDINFDGINDVLIYMGVTRQAQSLYKAFVWNPVTRQFYEVEEFQMIEEPTFDANSKTITSYARDGATMYIDTYQWKNGKLKKIASEKDEMN